MSASSEQLDLTHLSQLLEHAHRGDAEAQAQLMPLVFSELKRIAATQRAPFRNSEHTLNTTALVNEAWLKLHGKSLNIRDKRHFFSVAAMAMKQILLDEVKRKSTHKRAHNLKVSLSDNATTSTLEREVEWFYQLDEILNKLKRISPRLAEVFHLKYFCGLTLDEMAECLELSSKTVMRDWLKAKHVVSESMKWAE